MNKSFRSGIFSLEPDILKKHPVLDQLAQLFAQLHSSKMAYIDSAPFIETLELDNGVQQDSHEFLTLFLSLIEVPGARTIVQHLFRGSVSHVTRYEMFFLCKFYFVEQIDVQCGNGRKLSFRLVEDFY
jgi:ubiquitin carboxyl-terminal hydrolase 48